MCRPRAFVFLWERENKYVKCIHGQTLWCVPLFYIFKVVGKRYLHGGGLLLFFLSSLGVFVLVPGVRVVFFLLIQQK